MRIFCMLSVFFCAVLLTACNSENKDVEIPESQNASATDMVFDRSKWQQKEGHQYPFRDQMLKDVLYNDTIRSLSKSELISLLGEPDRSQDGHLYYLISRSGIGTFTLHTKTMVAKIEEDNTIEWIKVHE